MISLLVIIGVVSVVTAAVEIAFAEGIAAVARPLDFRGAPPNRERYKRIAFHLLLVIGLVSLVAAFLLWAFA
jgi:hypothetical protein